MWWSCDSHVMVMWLIFATLYIMVALSERASLCHLLYYTVMEQACYSYYTWMYVCTVDGHHAHISVQYFLWSPIALYKRLKLETPGPLLYLTAWTTWLSHVYRLIMSFATCINQFVVDRKNCSKLFISSNKEKVADCFHACCQLCTHTNHCTQWT